MEIIAQRGLYDVVGANYTMLLRNGAVPANLEDLPFDTKDFLAARNDANTIAQIQNTTNAAANLYYSHFGACRQVLSGDYDNSDFVGRYRLPWRMTKFGYETVTKDGTIANLLSLNHAKPEKFTGGTNSYALLSSSSNVIEGVFNDLYDITGIVFDYRSSSTGEANTFLIEFQDVNGDWFVPTNTNTDLTQNIATQYNSDSNVGNSWYNKTQRQRVGATNQYLSYHDLTTPVQAKAFRIKHVTGASFYLLSLKFLSDSQPAGTPLTTESSQDITHALAYPSNAQLLKEVGPLLLTVGGEFDGKDIVMLNHASIDLGTTCPDITYSTSFMEAF